MFRFRTAIYRVAGVRDVARLVVSHLWTWIYRTGITKERLLAWFQSFLKCGVPDERTADVLPAELVDVIARIMAGNSWNCGDLRRALEDALETPPPGFRWRVDQYGKHTLIMIKSDTTEKAIVRGKRFADKVFIGIWWTTNVPRGSNNQRLHRLIKQHDGAVFWNEKAEVGRQYGAFVIVGKGMGEGVAGELCALADRVDEEGGGEHRLSAISMDGVAEHRDVRHSDQVWVGCIRSIKFNWKHSLPDLLNGRIEEFRASRQYQDLVRLLREQ